MYYMLVILVALILSTIALKFVQTVRLLFKLGFKYDIVKFLVIVVVVVICSIYIIIGFEYKASGFVFGGLLSGLFLPAMFEVTRKKKKSWYGKKRPKSVSDSDYSWSFYGGSSSSDCGDVGTSGDSGSDGGSCD